MTQSSIYLVFDAVAILAVAIMLYLTEKSMPETTPTTIEQRVHAMLDDAMQNQYDISTWSVDDIVADLLAFAELNEDETEETIRPHVITWKASKVHPT